MAAGTRTRIPARTRAYFWRTPSVAARRPRSWLPAGSGRRHQRPEMGKDSGVKTASGTAMPMGTWAF